MLSIAAGYDPGYLTRSVGKGAENYYLAAVAEHGEPPGVWWGEGAAALGFAHGSTVDAAVMEKLFSSFLDPRDPEFLSKEIPDEEKARLGRRPQEFKSADAILAARLAAEPEATAERRDQLRIEAQQDARKAVYFFDLTFSPVKSVSLLHAGLQASALAAKEAGNAEQAAAYDRAAEAVWEAVHAGASASLAYARDHAGAARTGYHGVSIEGRSTGRWTEAGRWVVAQFRQHTNREGEPQLHVHQAVLNRQLCADGQWRSLDSRALHRVRAAAAAVGERVMEEQLTRTLGVEWRSRPDGHGREVVGVTEAQIEAFSTRRVQVTEDLKQRIADYEAAHGRAPSARAVFKMAQDATKATKAGKPKLADAPTRAEELRAWEQRTNEQEIKRLRDIPAAVLGRFHPGRAERARKRLAELNVRRVVEAAVTEAQAAKATFSRYELIRHLNAHLPDHLGGLPAERVEALLEELADMALDPAGPAGVRLLNAPELVEVPAELRTADGRSMYEAPCAQRYTTAAQLDVEAAVIASALAEGAPRLTAEAAAALLGIAPASPEPSPLGGPLHIEPTASAGTTGGTTAGGGGSGSGAGPLGASADRVAGKQPSLRADQAAAVYGILTSGRRTDVLSAAAGAGKSFTVARLAQVWREQTGATVVGLTTSQNAANVLVDEGLDAAHNIERWLDAIKRGAAQVDPGQLIVVDEASMVTTAHMRQIQKLAAAAGAKVVWTGDSAQLGAPGVGGMMRQVITTGGAYELVDVERMREVWEREASLRLREGDVQVLGEYDRRGRLLDGDREVMESAARRAYVADLLAGKRTLLLAPTNEQAAELSAQVRAELAAYGVVAEHGVTLRDGNTAGVGDLIMARQNKQDVTIGDTGRALTNRDVLQVEAVGAGTLKARLLDKDGRPGELVTIAGDYVAEHVELAYAGTVHAAQGRTVDTCHAIVDERVTREMLYVMLSRARSGNYAYAVVEPERQADLRPGPEQARDLPEEVWAGAGLAVLAAALERTEDDQTATEAMLAEAERVTHMGHLNAMWLDSVRENLPDAYIRQAEARGTLTAEEAAQLRMDEAKGSLGRLLWELELSGRDPHRILDAVITQRELDSADSLAKTLHWRITQAAQRQGVDLEALEPAESYIRGTWMARTPRTGLPGIDRLLSDLAMQAERRTLDLGARAAERPPAWLVEQVGPPPAEPVERGEWIQRAGRVLAYREQYGYASPVDAIGAAPRRTNPEQRLAWYAAYDALGRPQADRDIAAASLGELWVMRARYEREARWAPQYVAEDLKHVSITAREHAAEAERLRAQAAAAASADVRAALESQAAGYAAMAAELETRRAQLAEMDAARQAWHAATEDARVMAMRADAELRRRPEVAAELLPPLHRAAAAVQPPQRQEAEAGAEQVHPDQLTLFAAPEPQAPTEERAQVEEVDQAVERERERQAEPEAAVPGQTMLDLYGEVADADQAETGQPTGAGGRVRQAISTAILRARTARNIALGRRDEREAEENERLRRSQAERVQAESSASREHERLTVERAELEQRETTRAEQYRQAEQAAEADWDEMSL
ncbi:relaxase domain-containing protein [Planomonospora sp. ID91781]|uniref:MobF family relaxase n=1 Tax=Planomonospora sp. ID91781 TaxID=2738135 RepID=UPI0018C356AA|nr:MobF family relaxase [Planomonospora sp. ID91781]MBG0826154.1 relaxase domain-containing protein [Planomonospora sp. ID91781]